MVARDRDDPLWRNAVLFEIFHDQIEEDLVPAWKPSPLCVAGKQHAVEFAIIPTECTRDALKQALCFIFAGRMPDGRCARL